MLAEEEFFYSTITLTTLIKLAKEIIEPRCNPIPQSAPSEALYTLLSSKKNLDFFWVDYYISEQSSKVAFYPTNFEITNNILPNFQRLPNMSLPLADVKKLFNKLWVKHMLVSIKPLEQTVS